jgi:uncharacterized protein YegP (UPF0339 family)
VHDPAAGGVGWRLLGTNNRELGRSSRSYTDAEAALAAVAELRDLVQEAEAHIVHDASTGSWLWQLVDAAGAVVATSGRGFRHARECRYNLDQFREAAPSAPAQDAGVVPDFPWQRLTEDLVQQDGAS